MVKKRAPWSMKLVRTLDLGQDKKLVRLSVTKDGALLRVSHSRKKFWLPARELVDVVFRAAQRRYCEIKLSGRRPSAPPPPA